MAGGSSVSSSSQRRQDCNCPWPASYPWVQSGKGGHITHIRKPDAFLNKCIIFAIHAQKLSLSIHHSPKSSPAKYSGKIERKKEYITQFKKLFICTKNKKKLFLINELNSGNITGTLHFTYFYKLLGVLQHTETVCNEGKFPKLA